MQHVPYACCTYAAVHPVSTNDQPQNHCIASFLVLCSFMIARLIAWCGRRNILYPYSNRISNYAMLLIIGNVAVRLAWNSLVLDAITLHPV